MPQGRARHCVSREVHRLTLISSELRFAATARLVGTRMIRCLGDSYVHPHSDRGNAAIVSAGVHAPREAINDDEIDGYHIPAKSMIMTSQYITQRSPEFWEQPEAFDPERFTPERSAGRLRYAYFPFGLGQRALHGQSLCADGSATDFGNAGAALPFATRAGSSGRATGNGHASSPLRNEDDA